MKKETPEQALMRLFEEAGAKIIDCTLREQTETENLLPKKKEKKKLK
jgi:hypothetical protein